MAATLTAPMKRTPRHTGELCGRRPASCGATASLLAAVLNGLELEWSPQQISHRLRVDHPEDTGMRVSHETIYLSLFVQARSPLSPRLT